MESIRRLLLFIYNLLLMVIAGLSVAAAAGRKEPLQYIDQALATSQNRLIVAVVGVLILALGIFVFLSTIRMKPRVKSFAIDHSLDGEVSITVAAIKVIITKAVKTIEGIREIKPVVNDSPNGVQVYLHMMINPEKSVPELSKNVQEIVRKNLEDIGGLKVAEVKILIDDLNTGLKTSSS
jgi:uncharacterized alkaline shock family protein YloU